MKSKVNLSLYCRIITAFFTVLLIALICVFSLIAPEPDVLALLSIFFVAQLVLALLYAPLAIEVTDSEIVVRSKLMKHRIAIERIESIEPFKPTLGARRVFSTYGYFGYYGIYSEGDTGRYMAYYGKASDCFMLVMRNGDKYVLGCEDRQAMIDYIAGRLSESGDVEYEGNEADTAYDRN